MVASNVAGAVPKWRNGRRGGLKNRWGLNPMWVRLPPSAPRSPANQSVFQSLRSHWPSLMTANDALSMSTENRWYSSPGAGLHPILLAQGSLVSAAPLRVGDVNGPSVDLELALALGPVPVRYRAVHGAPAVPQQVECLSGPPRHAEIELTVGDERLDRAYPGPAVGPDRADERQPRPVEPLLAQPGEIGLQPLELTPPHNVLRRPYCGRDTIGSQVFALIAWDEYDTAGTAP